jgi:hypothetical protein
MLDRLLIWSSDQVCEIILFFNPSSEACAYRGSYVAGVIFLITITILAILVISILRRKW